MSKQTNSSAILESISDAIVDVTEKVSRSVVRVGAGRWRGGTGTVWSKDGHIVTSNHVIGDMREVEVGFSDGTKHTDRKSTRLNSSHLVISYAVFCLQKRTTPHPPS